MKEADEIARNHSVGFSSAEELFAAALKKTAADKRAALPRAGTHAELFG